MFKNMTNEDDPRAYPETPSAQLRSSKRRNPDVPIVSKNSTNTPTNPCHDNNTQREPSHHLMHQPPPPSPLLMTPTRRAHAKKVRMPQNCPQRSVYSGP